MNTTQYPTEGARIHAETGKTVRQIVLEQSSVPPEHHSAVSLLANFIGNTSQGYRPSDAMRAAIRVYEREGIEGVNAR